MNLASILLMAPSQNGQQNGYSSLIFLLLIFVIFYLFFIRPQVKKTKEQKKMDEA